MKDWLVRAIKTFVQAFLAIAVPEVISILSGSALFEIDNWKGYLIQIGFPALAAGISAVWNMYLESKKKKGEEK